MSDTISGEPADRTSLAPSGGPNWRRSELGRDVRIVLTTIGFTSLAWLVIGGLLMGWMWSSRPDEDRTIRTATDRAVTNVEDVAPAGHEATSRPRAVPAAPGATLAVPVAGVTPDALVDTYTQSRAGGARSHDAIDIMARAGTPVVAAASGSVEKLFESDDGGRTIYIRSGDGNWVYYYAHLQDYAPGLAEGQAIRAGDPLGRVGSTGNADAAAPHLHFAVMRMSPGDAWHEGLAVNPYPLLAGKRGGSEGL